MKKILLITLVLNSFLLISQTPCSGGFAGSYPCDGITLQYYYSLSNLGATTGNDSWGWTDPQDSKEYALVGLDNGTFFIDISDPLNPRRLGKLPSSGLSNWWRDIKVYQNHAFIVSEASGHGMQVFDLTRLRGLSTDPNRTFTEDAHYSFGTGKAHNIIINESVGYAYIVGTSTYSGGPHFVDISTPTSPTAAGGYSIDGYTHDAQVVTYSGPDSDYTGKEIFVGSNTDRVVILDVTNKGAVVKISEITYPNDRYTHQNWFTEDQRYILLGDEEDEVMIGANTKTFIFDLSNLDIPSLHFTYIGTNASIDHNGYVRGNRFYLSSYRAGLRIIKIDDIANQNMTEVSYFDTWPANNSANFDGAWNVYPFFESGNLIISNYNTGFFIVKDPNYDNVDPVVVCQNYTATLNKTTGSVTIAALDVDGGSTDNIGIVSRSINLDTFTCNDVGTHNVTLTVEDDYGNTSSCVAVVTVVGETTTYMGGGIWSNGIPGTGSNVKISTDYNTSTGGNSSIDACTCEVDATKTLTVAAGDYINITKDITVNGSLIIEHTGSVVQTNKNALVTNNGIINVDLTTPVLQTRDFMVMGSPMSAETRIGVFASAFLVLNHIPANFIPHPSVPAGGTNFADDNGDFWNQYTGISPINVGEGYIVRPQSGYTDPANTTYSMTYSQGTLNNGDVSRSVVFNGLGSNPDGTPNVYANPFASPISGVDFINDNALVNEIYFWEHLTAPSSAIPGAGSINFSMDDISMFNLSMPLPAANDSGTSTTPNGVISTGQGFGIKAFGTGILNFTNTMRLTSGNTTLRNPDDELYIDRITLKVSNTDYEIGSYTGVAFNPIATPQIDPGYDSNRIATVISLYSHLEDGNRQLGIQTREAFESSIKIPLGFATQVDEDATYKISISSLEGSQLSHTTVFLMDNQEDILTNLSQEDYEFKSDMGTFNGRFTLLFEEEIILGTSDLLDNISIFPNATDNIITILSQQAIVKSAVVYETGGRIVIKVEFDSEENYIIDLSRLETAMYFVRINTDKGSITKRVIKK